MTFLLRYCPFSSLLVGALVGACGVGQEVKVGVASVDPHGSAGTGGSPHTIGDASTGIIGADPETGAGGATAAQRDANRGPYDAGAPVPACGVGSVRHTALCSARPDDGIGNIVEKWRAPLSLSLYKPPLVANLTDDNGDGLIDACDTPDVLIVDESLKQLVRLNGATGDSEQRFDPRVFSQVTPAVGDLDADGVPEIVVIAAVEGDAQGLGAVVALSNAGAVVWSKPLPAFWTPEPCGAVFIRDLDGDGRAEVLAENFVFEADGELRFESTFHNPTQCQFPTAADLDGDGLLEVLMSTQLHSNTGTVLPTPVFSDTGISVAGDVVGDEALEIIRITKYALSVFQLDGTEVVFALPTNGCQPSLPVLVDLDLDGKLDIVFRNCEYFRLFSPAHPDRWTIDSNFDPGSITAFDLKATGKPVILTSRSGVLYFKDPVPSAGESFWPSRFWNAGELVVADVDADGSADILISVRDFDATTSLVAISHETNRWPPARRIWNQEAYSVDAVNEDGSPSRPRAGPRPPTGLRMNARLENGRICTGLL